MSGRQSLLDFEAWRDDMRARLDTLTALEATDPTGDLEKAAQDAQEPRQDARRPSMRPALVVGQRLRLDPAGPVYTVVRLTPAAAYVKGGEARHVHIDGRTADDPGRDFTAQGTTVIAISRNASVYREE